MKQNIRTNKLLFLLIFMILLAGIGLRIISMQSSFEYDEVWTFQHYLSLPFTEIFTQLATPNNHPLNTALLKIILPFKPIIFLYRLPALLAGIAVMLICCRMIWQFTKQKAVLLFAAVLTAFHPMLFYYSHTARGYSLQTLFVLLTAYSLFQFARGKRLLFHGGLFLISAIGSCLAITSGLLFVCALGGTFLIMVLTGERKERKRILKAFLLPAAGFWLFAGLWYGMNFHEIKAGQSFGSSVWNPLEFLKFVSSVSFELMLIPLFLILIAGVFFLKGPWKRFAIANLIFAGLVFLSALGTKAGPVRVYQPMLPILLFGAALILPAICREWKREAILPVSVILAIFFAANGYYLKDKISPPDWYRMANEIIRDLPTEFMVNYAPQDSYAVEFNHLQAKEDLAKRLSTFPLKGLVQANSKGNIELFDPSTEATVSFHAPNTAVQTFRTTDGVLMDLYQLTPLSTQTPIRGKPLLLAIAPARKSIYKAQLAKLMNFGEPWFLGNLFLNIVLYAPDGEEVKASFAITPAARYEAAPYLAITESSGGTFRFYSFRESD